MSIWYNRQGEPIDMTQANALLENSEYTLIAHDHVGEALVSTVWLGLDFSHGLSGVPLIFETLVLFSDGGPMAIQRYATEAEAQAGHLEAIRVILGHVN